MSAKIPDFELLHREHLARVARYSAMIEAVLNKYTKELAQLAYKAKYDYSGQFYFDDFPRLKAELDEITKTFTQDMEKVVLQGTSAEWNKANENVNKMVTGLLASAGVTDVKDLKSFGHLFNNHQGALKAFQNRTKYGFNLSKKVWDLAKIRKIETEVALSIAKGNSAANLARNVKKYLREPEKLFRRVRDEYGELRLSKNAKAYTPGSGVYRSSYKNALRLARTEINMAYRISEETTIKNDPIVVGYEIKRSATPYPCPVCEALQGFYPKDFVWSGWHPHCRCYRFFVLMNGKELDEYCEAIKSGEEYTKESVNTVSDVPKGYKNWIADNSERIAEARSKNTLPYFLRDNKNYGKYLKK